MKFRPCIDLHQGKVKQIVGSTLSDKGKTQINFTSDKPVEWYVDLYKKNNLTGGHIIMLGEGNNIVARQALKRWENTFHISGGMNLDNANQWLDYGANKIIFTSYIFNQGKIDWKRLEKLTNKLNSTRIVLDLSCKKFGNDYFIMTEYWKVKSSMKLNSNLLQQLDKFCDEFLIHSIDLEGKKKGIDKNLLHSLAQYKRIPITYAGGISNIQDIYFIKKIGNNKIDFTIGSALDIFGGNLKYKSIVNLF